MRPGPGYNCHMTIEISCTGKLKEKYWQDAAAEYSKRLSRFCKLKITELPEARLAGNSEADEKAVIEAESRAVLAKLGRPSFSGNVQEKGSAGKASQSDRAQSFVAALDVRGKELSSEALAAKLSDLALSGKSRIVFIIGGSLGLSEELLKACDMRLSFSPMTFPHQLMRVILLEQVYRAFKINAGETYHK